MAREINGDKEGSNSDSSDTKSTGEHKVENSGVAETMTLLDEGEKVFEVNTHDQTVLVVGNTSAGKSTLMHFIAGDNSLLEAFTEDEDDVIITIRDAYKKISDSTIVSKTIFPEFLFDPVTNTAFYDCPGFSDTRSTQMEIVNAYFTKKAADGARRVKIILTVNHTSLLKGGDRKDFPLALKQVTNFITDMEKYKDSIALIATKVDIDKADDKIIRSIGKFLVQTRNKLDAITGIDLPKTKTLIDALLKQDEEGVYTRISFIRRPKEVRKLSEILELQANKAHISHVVQRNVLFATSHMGDFSFTLSEKAKNDVRSLNDALNDGIVKLIEELVVKLNAFYSQVLKRPLSLLQTDLMKLLEFLRYLIVVEKIEHLDSGSKTRNYLAGFLSNIQNLSAESSAIEEAILKYADYLDFLIKYSTPNSHPTQPRRWTAPLYNFGNLTSTILVNLTNSLETDTILIMDELSSILGIHLNSNFKNVEKLNSLLDGVDLIQQIGSTTECSEEFFADLIQSLDRIDLSLLSSPHREFLKEVGLILDLLEANGISSSLSTSTHLTTCIAHLQAFIPNLKYTTFQGVTQQIDDQIKVIFQAIKTQLEYQMGENFKQGVKRPDFETWVDGQLAHFKGVLNFADDERAENNVAGFLGYILKNFTSRIQNGGESYQKLIESAKSLGKTLDRLRDDWSTKSRAAPKDWISSLFKFVQNLEATVSKPKLLVRNESGEDFNVTVAEGIFVSLSDVVDACLPLKSGQTHLLVSSLHTVRIDTNLSGLRALTDLTIISPNWIIEGDRQIQFQGAHGNGYSGYSTAGQGENGEGNMGEEGNPGKNGGNFLGISQNIIGGVLNITSRGGNGGRGQDGGAGQDGQSGRDVDVNSIRYKGDPLKDKAVTIFAGDYTWDESSKELSGQRRNNNAHYGWWWGPVVAAIVYATVPDVYDSVDYWFRGSEGSAGRNGGDGGRGGAGGSGGSIKFIPSVNTEFFSKHVVVGTVNGVGGESGVGGRGGRGGSNGRHTKVRFHTKQGKSTLETRFISNKPDGAHGKTPSANNNLINHNSTSSLWTNVTRQQLILYRTFGIKLSTNPILTNCIHNFHKYLNTNEEMKQISSGLVMVINEFEGLEHEYRGLKSHVNFAPFYKIYMEKIFQNLSELQTCRIDSAPSPSAPNTVTNDNEKILLYLYTASLSRFNRLTLNYESNLIIDIDAYLALAQEGLTKFKENSNSAKLLAIIKTTQAAYNDQINEKLKEAAKFVESIINPEMSRIQNKLNSKVESLLVEIDHLKNQVVIEGRQLERKREELRTQMILTGVFGGLKVVAAVANFVSGVGTVVGAGIGVAAFAGKAIASAATSGQTHVTQIDIPSVVKAVNSDISERTNIWHQDFLVQLTATSHSLDKNEFTKMSEKVSLIRKEVDTKLNEISKSKSLAPSENSNFSGAGSNSDIAIFISMKKAEVEFILEENLNSEEYLDKVGTIVDFEDDENEAKRAQQQLRRTQLKALITIQNLNQLLVSGAELYTKLQNNQNHIDEVSAAIGENKDKSKKLNQFQKNVETVMGPMLGRMQEDLGKIRDTLEVSSVTGLDVTKWEVTQKLQDIKNLMKQQFTQGFKIEGDMARAFEKLEEAFTTLIKVYERIQQFQQESKLGNYIAEINSAQFQNQRSSADPKLDEAVKRLDTQIQANLILGQYELILNSLKMWAFPFAEFYLADLQIPEVAIQNQIAKTDTFHNNADHNVDIIRALIEAVSSKIDKIRERVREDKSTHKEIHSYIHFSKFIHSTSTQPFYVWNYAEFGPLTLKLLGGQKIVLKVDISKAPHSHDAIKFNKIGLRLTQDFRA